MENLQDFKSCSSFVTGFAPARSVEIHSAEELKALIDEANEKGYPVIPVSSGGEHRHGGCVPAVPEAVIADLSGMKKILSVNPQFNMVIVEPGVTYGELKEALAPYGMEISMPLAPKAEKSVIASLLDPEPRLNPHTQWTATDPLRCMEVTWGDGNRMFTGDAGTGVQDLQEQQARNYWQIAPGGPDRIDYIRLLTRSQGILGTVTWASIRCRKSSDVNELRMAPAKRYEEAADFIYNVLRLRFGDMLFTMNRAAFALLMADSAEGYKALKGKLPAWCCAASASGRPPLDAERVAAHMDGIAGAAQQSGLEFLPAVGGITGKALWKRAGNPCEAGKYWKNTAYGAAADIFFVTTPDRARPLIDAVNRIAGEVGYPVDDIGIYMQPQHQGCNCHFEFILPYDPANETQTAAAKALFEKASAELSRLGAYFSRPYGEWAKLQLGRDTAGADTLRKIRSIFDPNGVMNPGRLTVE